jgi:ankyrin repeat protein
VFAYVKPFPNESSAFSFLYECVQAGAFAMSEICHEIAKLTKSSAFSRSIAWLYCYFAPEIYNEDPAFGERLSKGMQHVREVRQFPCILRNFARNIAKLAKDDWKELKSQREFFKDDKTLISAIRNDDIDGLVEFSKSPLFNVDDRITPSAHLPSALLQCHPTLIQAAALFGSIKCFRFLVLNGADLHAIDNNSLSLPQFAVAGGNIEIIRLCEQYGLNFFGALHTAAQFHRNELFYWLSETLFPDPNEFDATGQSCLHAACESNNLYALQRCLASGADPNLPSFRGWTPLRMAVRHGHFECVRLLFEVGDLDPNPRTHNGVTPLHLAAKHGHLEIASFLIDRGADINAVSNQQWSALFFAVMNRRVHIAKYLLSFPSVDVNIYSFDKLTALSLSIGVNCAPMTEFLLADPRVHLNDFLGPIFLAIRHNRFSVFKSLIERPDIDLTLRGPRNETFLHHLTLQDSQLDFVNLLLQQSKIDINAVDDTGATPLHHACYHGAALVVRALLGQPGIDVNPKTKMGYTALNFASVGGNPNIIFPLLMRPEMDINAIGGNGSAPIHGIIVAGLIDCLRAICWRTDLDVNARTETPSRVTPLMMAAAAGRADMMMVLLRYPGIDREAVCSTGRTAYGFAKHYGFADCARLVRPPRVEPEVEVPVEVVKKNAKKKLPLLARITGRFRPKLVV